MTDNPRSSVAALDRINLRLSHEVFAAIDTARGARAGHVSRNSWIAEAIAEKLSREVERMELDRVANG